MSNQFTIPKIVSSQKISGTKEYKPTLEKLKKSLGYRKVHIFGLDNMNLLDGSIKSKGPILFTFKNSSFNQLKKLNKQEFIRLTSNKIGKLTSTQQKIQKTLSTVGIYTVVDEKNDLVMNVPHSFLESKKEDRNNWEVPIHFSFLDKKHASFYCDDLNEEFCFSEKKFKIRALNLGVYYELVYTQGPKNLFYLFADLNQLRIAESFPKSKLGGIGLPSFGYKHLVIKNKQGDIWDGKFPDLDSNQRVTPVFLNYKDSIKYWKKFRKSESNFRLPRNPPIEYLKLDRQIFKNSESDFLSKNFVFFPSSDSLKEFNKR